MATHSEKRPRLCGDRCGTVAEAEMLFVTTYSIETNEQTAPQTILF